LKKRIAFFTPALSKYSESFIQAHITGLKGEIDVFHDGDMPLQKNGVLINQPGVWDYRLQRFLGKGKKSPQSIALSRMLRQGKYQIAFVEYGTTAVRIFSTIQELKMPLIVHFHGFDISMKRVLDRNGHAYKEIFDYASLIIVVSREMEQKAIQLGCSFQKIMYNPCGANNSFSNVSRQDEGNVFVSVGRFVEKKGPLYTLISFHLLINKGFNAYLQMVGEGPLLGVCKDYVRAHKLEKFVSFLGVRSAEEIADLFANSSCYVQHSITAESGDQEGTPVSIMEAMLAGLPVISTKHGGIKDIVKENSGILVSERDVQAMSNAMEKVIRDPNGFKLLGINARKYILENHTLEIHLDRINSFIDSL
jgi:colanic acid/amylovoran biosynthesis glycosyltransferase